MNNLPLNIDQFIIQLHEIYNQIPTFNCIKSCTDCCGPIFMTGIERYLIEIPENFTGMTSCPWRGKGHCKIYDKRPLICRLFGTINDKRLMCSFGKGPTFLLQSEYGKRMIKSVFDLSSSAGFDEIYSTHEGLYENFLSPTRIPIHLKGYNFNDKI